MSAREIQPGPFRAPGLSSGSVEDRAVRPLAPEPGALLPGGALATGSDSAINRLCRKVAAVPALPFSLGRRGVSGLRSLQPAVNVWERGSGPRNDVTSHAPALQPPPAGGTEGRDRRPVAVRRTGWTVLSAAFRRRRRTGRRRSRTGAGGQRGASVAHPTRLETRTKESNTCASRRVERNPRAQ